MPAGAPTRGTRPTSSLTPATPEGQGQAVYFGSLARGKRNPCGRWRTSKKRWRHKVGVGEGGRGSDGRSPKRQQPRGHSPNRTQRGGSGGEMLHPPGHTAMQHAGDAKKAERSGGDV